MVADFDRRFIWKISICSSVAYLFATVPQVMIDPLLHHHVRFPPRQYPYAFFIAPLCVAVFIATYLVMKKSNRILWNTLPFTIAVLLSMPIFKDEIPHGHLSAVSFIWLIFLLGTLWIRNRKVEADVINDLKSTSLKDSAKIEYLKEEVQFWRMVLVGIAGGYIAVIISWINFLLSFNKGIVGGNDAEVFVLNLMSLIGVGLYSVGLMICPLAEALRKHRESTGLFLIIKEAEEC